MSHILLTTFIIDIMYWQNHTCGPPAQICKTDCRGKALLEGVFWKLMVALAVRAGHL